MFFDDTGCMLKLISDGRPFINLFAPGLSIGVTICTRKEEVNCICRSAGCDTSVFGNGDFCFYGDFYCSPHYMIKISVNFWDLNSYQWHSIPAHCSLLNEYFQNKWLSTNMLPCRTRPHHYGWKPVRLFERPNEIALTCSQTCPKECLVYPTNYVYISCVWAFTRQWKISNPLHARRVFTTPPLYTLK